MGRENKTPQQICKVRTKKPLRFFVRAMERWPRKANTGTVFKSRPKENRRNPSVCKMYLTATPFSPSPKLSSIPVYLQPSPPKYNQFQSLSIWICTSVLSTYGSTGTKINSTTKRQAGCVGCVRFCLVQ